LIATFFGIGVFSFGVLGLTQFTGAQAADCSDNSIMRCGAASATEFKNKCNANAEGDLRAIYGHYWIPCDVQVVEGQSFKDNTVRVGGRVVATNAQSIGRVQKPGDHAISIAGRTYWEAPNSVAFKSDGLPTLVALDAQGNFKYAILKDCGNPIYAKPTPPPEPPKPQPQYGCNSLNITTINNTKKRFSASASATNGAQIVGYVFNFGDGKTLDTTSSTAEYTYAGPGNYTAKVTVKVRVGNETKLVDGASCMKSVEVKVPAAYDCTALNVASKGNNAYDFTIVETHTNATYKGATLNFGDGQTAQVNGTTASHQYAKPGNYTIVATLSFDVDGQVKSVRCEAKVTMEVCPTNPSLPKDSPDCAVCPYNPNLPKNSPDCEAPQTPVTELPKTGMGDMLLGGFGASSMIVSASLYIGSRKDLLATLLNR
jgi:PKD repeat protein